MDDAVLWAVYSKVTGRVFSAYELLGDAADKRREMNTRFQTDEYAVRAVEVKEYANGEVY